MNFSYSLIGHEKQRTALERDAASGSIAHAYLFSGPAQIGKATLARRFVQIMQCERDGCGECAVCRSIVNGTHPDVRILADDNHDAISIAETRDIVQWAQLSHTSPYAVCIIESCDRMSLEALQSLLKILEEPPHGVVFLLTTTVPYALPSTILSRMRHIALRLVPDEAIQRMCVERGSTFESWETILRVIDGRPGRAVQLSEDANALKESTDRIEQAAAVLTRYDIVERFRLARDIAKDSAAVEKFLDALLLVAREKLLGEMSPRRVYQMTQLVRLITNIRFSLATTTTNPRLNLEHLMMTI